MLSRPGSVDFHIFPYTNSLSHYKWLYINTTHNSEWRSEWWVVFTCCIILSKPSQTTLVIIWWDKCFSLFSVSTLFSFIPMKRARTYHLNVWRGVLSNLGCLIIYGQGCLKYKIGDLYHNLRILFGFLKVLCMWNRRLQSSSWTRKRLKSVTV